jgi:Kef-type K+ transport system membrane component KefB
MYQTAAMLATFLLIYSAVAGRVERSWISGPIVFTGVGFILGPDGLGVLHINISGEGLRLLAELTLAMVLFTDAASADLTVVRRNLGLNGRFRPTRASMPLIEGLSSTPRTGRLRR